MNGENAALESFKAKAADVLADRAAMSQALDTPMPGPLAQAFAPQQDIEVDRYKIRPFVDWDFEILQSLEHPLGRKGESIKSYLDGISLKDVRGPNAWLACWLLTHDIDTADKAWADGKIQDLAKREFGKLQIGGLALIMNAVFTQYGKYFSTVVGVEGDDEEDGQKKSITTEVETT